MRPFLAALLLLPAVGSAQSIALTVTGATNSVSGSGGTVTSTLALNGTACAYQVGVAWTGTSLTTACTPLYFWLTTTSCGTAPSTTNIPADVTVQTIQVGDLTAGTSSGTFTFPFNSLPGFVSLPDGGGFSCGSVNDFTNFLCAGVTTAATGGMCNGATATAPPVNMRYDNIPPIPPIVGITPLDTKLGVNISPGDPNDTLLYYTAQYALAFPDGDAGTYFNSGCGQISTTNSKCTISNLVDGTDYYVVGYSVDEASNVSVASAPMPGTPVLTYGFYANYLNDGGQPGGCGSAAGGAPSALAFTTALLLFAVARRRG